MKIKKIKEVYKEDGVDYSKALSKKERNDYEIDIINKMLTTKNMQFPLHNIALAKFGIDIDSPLALEYHFKQTTDFDSFIESINRFLSTVNEKLKSDEVNRLKTEYNKRQKKSGMDLSQDVIDNLLR